MAYSSLIFCNLYFFRSLAIFFKCAIKLTWLIRPPFHSLEFSFCVFVEWIVQKIDIGIKKVFRIWLVLSFACYNPLHMWRFKACWRFCWDLLTRAIKTLNWASRTEQRWMHFARFTFLPRTTERFTSGIASLCAWRYKLNTENWTKRRKKNACNDSLPQFVIITCSRFRDSQVRWIMKKIWEKAHLFPALPTFRVPFSFPSYPLSESLEQPIYYGSYLAFCLYNDNGLF